MKRQTFQCLQSMNKAINLTHQFGRVGEKSTHPDRI